MNPRGKPILFSARMVRAILEGKKTQTRRLCTHRNGISFLGGCGQENDLKCWGYFFDNPRGHHGYAVLARGLNERFNHGLVSIPSPYGEPGDRLWVRETFWIEHDYDSPEMAPSFDCGINIAEDDWARVMYCATPGNPEKPNEPGEWFGPDEYFEEREWIPWGAGGLTPQFYSKRPAIFMPRWASRIDLEIVSIRVERLQDITEEDAQAEGAPDFFEKYSSIGRDQRLTSGELAADAPHRAAFAVLWDEINYKRALWSANPFVWVLEFKPSLRERHKAHEESSHPETPDQRPPTSQSDR